METDLRTKLDAMMDLLYEVLKGATEASKLAHTWEEARICLGLIEKLTDLSLLELDCFISEWEMSIMQDQR